MMNWHELTDVATIRLSALLLREAKFFVRSADTLPLVDATTETTPPVDKVGDPSTAGRCDVVVDTPLGAFETAYLPWQWLGPEYPTLVYHHGSGERPFDVGRFSTNSFRRLFLGLEEDLPVNLIAVRAPFHDGSSREYARAMGEIANFVGMLAASAGLFEALTERIADRTDGPVALSGISLGGWAVNLHRACFGSADRYDRIIEYECQRPSYTGKSLSVLNRGHVTGALAAATLRQHVLGAIPEPNDGEMGAVGS